MLCVASPQPGGLLDAFMGAPGLLLDLLGYWHCLPAALMRRRKMRRRKMRMRKMRRKMRKMRRRMRRRRGRQRRKGRGPAWPRVLGRSGGHHGLPPPLQEHLEYLQEGEDLAAGSGQLEEGPATSQGPAPRRGKGENSGGGPWPGARAPSASSDREVGGSLGEDPKSQGEEATARPGMEKHLEEVGDGQKQLRGGPSRPQQDGEHLGTGGKPEGGLEPRGGEAARYPRGDADPGRPITKNPLVLSFFYCPSEEEEEEEDEEEDEDWLSDEEGNAGGSVCSGAGTGRGCSGTDWTDSEGELEDEARREESEEFWGALHCGHDSFNPLRLATAPTPPRPNDREFRVSFYLRAPASEPETVGDPWSPPEKPWPMRWGTPCTTHRCEMGSRGAGDPGKAENLDSRGNWAAKKVRFSPVVTVHPLLVWPFASRAARRGPWEELARDRSRFRRRIEQLEAVLGPCLEAGHRARAWRKIHGAAPEPAEQGLPFPFHEGQETQDVSLPLCCEKTEEPGVREGQVWKHSDYRGVEDPGVRDGRVG